MASPEPINGGAGAGGGGGGIEGGLAVELVASTADPESISEDQITPLLAPSEKPKINIFSASYPRRKPNKVHVARLPETETSSVLQFILWAWSGSRYSGLLCMTMSSSVYCIMEVLSDIFSDSIRKMYDHLNIVIYLAEKEWTTSIWAAECQEHFGFKGSSWIFLIVEFYILAIILSFTTPIMASIAARIIWHEKLRIAEIGGLACSFFGMLFIFRPMRTTQGGLAKAGEASDLYVQGIRHTYAVLIGLFSSISGGMSYCLIRAGAKASDQPVVTIFSFAMLATPAAAICTFSLQDFVLPGLNSFLLMVGLGVLAFFAEVFLARGLQLEKTSKVANILYLEAALSQIWGMASSRVVPSFGRLVGCTLILVSACCTMYIGPEKDIEPNMLSLSGLD
ncbi:hypothetical protein RJ640_013686 [Escallonia rubra]|uniref:EamA domain-containing protein n=1 Tax=Escallonia rubra TaxID=112253 RepID=A0AA88UKV7_9ASTE|nr:hypothetical protein RJ640_013686 [Escallonia rubra]